MPQNIEKLKRLLAEIFRLDKADLDFGIYRIMGVKHEEIARFLDEDLLPQVGDAFREHKVESRDAAEAELDEAMEKARDLGAEPEDLPRVRELREKLSRAADVTALENEVYSHLHDFFRRYYREGDFISQRRYKDGVYAIPYEGEEVKLHWANHDQYYTKTSERLRDYTFRVPSGKRVRFKLADADTDRDNNRTTNGNERRFVLSRKEPPIEEEGELVIRFDYRPPPEKAKQVDINAETVDCVLNRTEGHDIWRRELAAGCPTGKNGKRTLLEKHLADYTARNTLDYFIHKDLGRFLRRELDFYIKNEVMHIDDVESDTAPRVEQYLSKVRVFRRLARKIIDFLAQIEDFQKKLWLKKKFVVDAQYCITLDRVPAELYPEIAANQAQREEWVRLFAIDDIKGDKGTPRYSEPLTTEFLEAHQHLVVDTAHFGGAFKIRLLSGIGDCDGGTDGLLVRGENFQAISLLAERYGRQVECLYLDPPYNTGDSEILYKNEYPSASWLTLMENRLTLAVSLLLSEDPVLFIAIDDFEMVDLCELIDTHFPMLRREMIVVNHHPQGGKAKTLASTHEYMLACVARGSDRTLRGRVSREGVEHRPFKRSGTAESNFRRARPNSFYAILVDPDTKGIMGAEKPPPLDVEYPTEPTEEGHLRIYPIGSQGEGRVWRRSYEQGSALIAEGKLECTVNTTIYQLIEAGERTPALFSNWIKPRYNAGVYGANLLSDIIGEHNPFSYPKSIHTVEDAIFSAALDEDAVCLDYFAGSGTTGHAVINLNRADGGGRKYILAEMGGHFDTVLLPRIKKVVYSKDWRSGKPVSREGTSQMFKYVRLESYEDTLNNLQIQRTRPQQDLLAGNADFREDYILRYMLDIEAKGSASLLNVGRFEDPFGYRLDIAEETSGNAKSRVVDLVETFNYLIGLRVGTVGEAGGVRVFTGMDPRGKRTLILWRNTRDLDSDALDAWFREQGHDAEARGYDVIYVNGDNNLENIRPAGQTWKVRLIEEEFRRRMFGAPER